MYYIILNRLYCSLSFSIFLEKKLKNMDIDFSEPFSRVVDRAVLLALGEEVVMLVSANI